MSRLDEIDLPRKALQECVAISGIAAVCVITRRPLAHRRQLRSREHSPGWCEDPLARLVSERSLAAQIADDAAHRSVAKPEDAIRAVDAGAAHKHAKLTEHANVMPRLQQALDHVTRHLDEAR